MRILIHKIGVVCVMFAILVAVLNCAGPRENIMCLKYWGNSDTASWVSCPKGIKPGTYLNKPKTNTWK